MVKKLIFLVFLLSLVGISLAAIYKWVDEEGNVHYSDSPASDRKAEQLHVKPPPPKYERDKSRQRLQKLLEEQRQRQQLRKHEAKEKKQAALRKADANKFADLVLEFGGNWVIGIGLEQQCQEKYNLSCDALLNWKKHAIKKCKDEHGSDQDCGDDAYLLRFKPLTIEEQRQRAIQLRSRQRRLYNK